ncbi:MAG TPA: undecaprenyl-diphosphate phosphatase, partial [Solirubrobacteraceae bacterium]|nr:undecaprenyl-diphosphate phosphatase [Solirubrobacteraceae bacterium]
MHGLISYFQAVVLGLVQGIAEPFPISSLGHSVILPRLAGWDIGQGDNHFITFLVATHLATAIVLFGFFFDDWRRILTGLWRSVRGQSDPTDVDAKLGWLLVVGTVPAGVIGLALQKPLQSLFASAVAAAAFLVLNGVLLLGFERLRTRPQAAGLRTRPQAAAELPAGSDEPAVADARLAGLSFRQALLVGLSQAGALIPGISRSGVSMGGGLLAGLDNED